MNLKIKSQKAFIQIPILIAVIISLVVAGGIGTGVVLYKQRKLASLNASVSQIFKETNDIESEVNSKKLQLDQEPSLVNKKEKREPQFLEETKRKAKEEDLRKAQEEARIRAEQELQRQLETHRLTEEQRKQEEKKLQEKLKKSEEKARVEAEQKLYQQFLSAILRYEEELKQVEEEAKKAKQVCEQEEEAVWQEYSQRFWTIQDQIDQLENELDNLINTNCNGNPYTAACLTGEIRIKIDSLNNQISSLVSETRFLEDYRKMALDEIRIKCGKLNELEKLEELKSEEVIPYSFYSGSSLPQHYSIIPNPMGGYTIYDKNSYNSWVAYPNAFGGYDIYER